MTIKQCVVLRIKELCEKKGITLNTLANSSGLTPSTVYTLICDERKDIGITTIKKLCDGLEMDLVDFFDSEGFKTLSQEIE